MSLTDDNIFNFIVKQITSAGYNLGTLKAGLEASTASSETSSLRLVSGTMLVTHALVSSMVQAMRLHNLMRVALLRNFQASEISARLCEAHTCDHI